MIFTGVVVVLIIAIAFYQALQGLFSSIVLAVLSILCALLALACYEPLAESMLHGTQPATADAIALIALFVLPLLGLRIVCDIVVKDNVSFGTWPDRIGGGLVGLFTGTVLVGVLTLAAQMLPFGTSVLGYEPFDETLRPKHRLAPFYPDEFVIALAEKFSVSSLGCGRSFAQAHDDLRLELFCARNMNGADQRVDAPQGALSVKAVYCPDAKTIRTWQRDIAKTVDGALTARTDTQKICVVRVAVADTVREPTRSKQRSNWFMLPATHFRLVTANHKSHYPVAYLWYNQLPDKQQWSVAEAKLGRGDLPRVARFIVTRPHDNQPRRIVDWVYFIDEADLGGIKVGSEDPTGAYLVFRRAARAALPQAAKGMPDKAGALEIYLSKRDRDRLAREKKEKEGGAP